MHDYLFETNKQNAYVLAEKHNLSEYDRDYIRHNFWPIIKVNNYNVETIKEKIKALKNEFIKENTIFDLEIFKRENTDYLIYELNQYIDVLKRGKVETWEEYGNEIFHIFKMESDTKDSTLIISNKNITQLEIYFKSILNIIQEFINPETINLQNSTKTQHGIIEDFETSQGLSQREVRRSIRTHIKINYELSLKEFLQTNHLADEIFYINFIDKNQKERLHELEKEVSFFDISEGEKVTDDIADQWYNEKITRDHYWYYKEYQTFLKERLTELEKIKTIGKGKKSNFDITKEVDDFEVFSNNFETEITTLFNQNITKNEKLNTYYNDYFPKYLTRVNDIVSHIEQMENDFKLNFPELQTDLQNLNTITSKFKKSILNDLETALNTVLKIDYERLLFEYLNITNKLETDLQIEGKKISTLFEIFYNRMLHIKSNPKPQQLKLSNSTKNEQRIMIVSENTKPLFYRLITERFSKWELENIVSELEPQDKLPFLNEINYLFKQQPIIFWKNVCFCYNKTGLVYPDDLGKTYFEDGEEYHLDTFFGTMGVYLDDVFETVNTYDIHTEMFVNSFADSVKNLIKIFKNQNKFQSQQTETDTSTVEKNIIIIKEKNSEMFSNNGFELFEYILNEHVKPKEKKGRKSDLIYYYWEMYNSNPQYIHQRPAPFFKWFDKEYNETTGQLKTYDNVKTPQRIKDYSTALELFKSKNK